MRTNVEYPTFTLMRSTEAVGLLRADTGQVTGVRARSGDQELQVSAQLTVACDGRGDDEAGLTMAELAWLMVGLGARDAINLDGGGSATLIAGGRMRNRPRGSWGVDLVGGRPLATALTIRPRPALQRRESAATAA